MGKSTLEQFIKEERKKNSLTQEDLARMTGVGLRFIRDMEQGKKTLRLDKVNQVLAAFGHEMAPLRREENTK
jgi:y4mF family transcriptional regulator